MSERFTEDAYFNYTPSLEERARVYIGDVLNENNRSAAASIAEDFARPDTPLAKTAVLIPVAAHQDAEYIIPTLSEYAKQKGAKPFTVLLSLNAPFDSVDESTVTQAEQYVAKAQALFPELDVRAATTQYSDPTIGRIRADLWNAALLLAHHEGSINEDIIGINNDIDTAAISPHYIARIQSYYDKKQDKYRQLTDKSLVLSPAATRVTHAVSKDHPNVARVTSWVDNSYFQSKVAYEAGMVIPFSSYVQRQGFNGDAVTHETAFVLHDSINYIAGAQLYTSPRRYIERLQQHGSDEIWTKESFGANDACRDSLPGDISFERAEDVIIDRLDADLQDNWLDTAISPVAAEAARILQTTTLRSSEATQLVDYFGTLATKDAEHQLSKASYLLSKALGMHTLATMVMSDYGIQKYIDGWKDLLHSEYRDSKAGQSK